MKNYLLILALFLSLYTTAQTSEQLVAVNHFTNLAAMNSVANPISGSLAFNLDNNILYYYDGTEWTPTSEGWRLNGNIIFSETVDYVRLIFYEIK